MPWFSVPAASLRLVGVEPAGWAGFSVIVRGGASGRSSP